MLFRTVSPFPMVFGKVVCFLQFCLAIIYIDDLLDDLRNCGVGCFWDSVFAGAMGYADNVVHLQQP